MPQKDGRQGRGWSRALGFLAEPLGIQRTKLVWPQFPSSAKWMDDHKIRPSAQRIEVRLRKDGDGENVEELRAGSFW